MAHARPVDLVTGAPRGIGATVALASGHFRFATGAVIILDGGLSLPRP
jgi:NAD(P)-dependent dehydrogenase (short-subunit alcohol dehydrogenase family)